ncbi:MAG: hypothetical protein ACXAC8_02255 [Candidatus Hodarchaeales archaeon]
MKPEIKILYSPENETATFTIQILSPDPKILERAIKFQNSYVELMYKLVD